MLRTGQTGGGEAMARRSESEAHSANLAPLTANGDSVSMDLPEAGALVGEEQPEGHSAPRERAFELPGLDGKSQAFITNGELLLEAKQ